VSRPLALCLALGIAIVTGSGCVKCGRSVSQRIAEKAIEGAVEKATGGRAEIQVGSEVDLSFLPASLRYPNAAAKQRWSMSRDQGTGTVYSFETRDPAPAVADFYKKALANWKSLSVAESEQATILSYGSEDQKRFVTVNVSRDEDTKLTSLTILYTKKD
jgi:hypothetical protein